MIEMMVPRVLNLSDSVNNRVDDIVQISKQLLSCHQHVIYNKNQDPWTGPLNITQF